MRFLFWWVLQREMNMIEDAELLRQFASKHTEDDFTELVRRHLNLVYSAALRQVSGNHQLAEEVTQSVFTDLARKAESLLSRESLTGWLYTSAHFAAAKVVRGEQRRRLREQEAHIMQETNANSGAELQWEQLQPVIDDAMHELPEADREAILQRYFEKQPFLQIGAKLGLTENAARMRVERALEKLRGILETRGVASTSVALAAVLGAQAVSAAPVALSATVVGTSLAAVVGGAATALSIFTATKLKVAVPVLCAVAAVVALFVQNETLSQLRNENAALLAAQRSVTVDESPVVSQDADDEVERLRREKLELLKLRGEVGRLRRELAEMSVARAIVYPTNETVEAESPKESTQQINVKARFVTGSDEALGIFGLPGDAVTRVVSGSEMETLLDQIKKSESIETIGELQVTTLSGRQAQISKSGAVTNEASVFESGYVLDVLPKIREDDQSIDLKIVISKTSNEQFEPVKHGGAELPVFRLQQVDASASVWDGQTVVMSRRFDEKKVVVLITPTLITREGNRVH